MQLRLPGTRSSAPSVDTLGALWILLLLPAWAASDWLRLNRQTSGRSGRTQLIRGAQSCRWHEWRSLRLGRAYFCGPVGTLEAGRLWCQVSLFKQIAPGLVMAAYFSVLRPEGLLKSGLSHLPPPPSCVFDSPRVITWLMAVYQSLRRARLQVVGAHLMRVCRRAAREANVRNQCALASCLRQQPNRCHSIWRG